MLRRRRLLVDLALINRPAKVKLPTTTPQVTAAVFLKMTTPGPCSAPNSEEMKLDTSSTSQNQTEVIVISDDEDQEPPFNPDEDNDDDDSDDGIEFIICTGPASARINAQRKLPNGTSGNVTRLISSSAVLHPQAEETVAGGGGVATRVTLSNRMGLGKRRAVNGEGERGWEKRRRGEPARLYTVADAARAGIGSAAEAGEGVKTEAHPPEVPQLMRFDEHPELSTRINSWSTHAAAATVAADTPYTEPAWRPPTPPRSSSITSIPDHIELSLPNHTRLAPGAREYKKKVIWTTDAFSIPSLPFSIDEIPSFERGSWLRLCTHRYLVVSRFFAKTPVE